MEGQNPLRGVILIGVADAVVAHRRDAESELIRKQTAAQGKVWSTLWTFFDISEGSWIFHTHK